MAQDSRGNGAATAIAAIERRAIDAPDKRDIYVTAFGVKLQLRPVAMLKINAALNNIPEPKPPMLAPKTDDENEPWIENHADPTYVTALRAYDQLRQDIGLNVALYESTKVISVPEGMFSPDVDDWIAIVEDADLMGEYAPKVRTGNLKLRYIDYLKFYAMNDADFSALSEILRRWSGSMLERDVEEAEDSFRDHAGRDADSGVGNPERPRGRARS